MDTVDQEWNEFQKSLKVLKKAPALRDQLNVISAQLNEIEQDTKEIPKIKQELAADQTANDQIQPDAGMGMGMGMDPNALQQGAGMGAPAPEDDMGGDINKSMGEAEIPTEPIADAVNMDTGDDKVIALFNQLIQALSESAHVALDNGDIGRLMMLTNVQSNLTNIMKDLGPLAASVPQNDLDGGVPLAKAAPTTDKPKRGEAHTKTLKEVVGDNYKDKYKLDRRSMTNLYKLYKKFENTQKLYLDRTPFDSSDPAKFGSHAEIANAVRYADPDTYEYLIDKYHIKGRKPSLAEMIGAEIMSEQKSRELGHPVVIQPPEVPDAVVHYINRKILENTYNDLVNTSAANSEVDFSTGSNRQAGVLNKNKYLRNKEVYDDEFGHFLPYTIQSLSLDDIKAAKKERDKVRIANNQMWTKEGQPIIRGNSDEVKAADKNFEDIANRVNGQYHDWQTFARAYPRALRNLIHHPMERDEAGNIKPLEELSTEDTPIYGYRLSDLGSGLYPVKIHEGSPDFDIIYGAVQDTGGGIVEDYLYHDELDSLPEGVKAEPMFAIPKGDNYYLMNIIKQINETDPNDKEAMAQLEDRVESDYPDIVTRGFTDDQRAIMKEYMRPLKNANGEQAAPEWFQFVEDFPTLSRIVRKYGELDGGAKLDLDTVHALAKDRNPLYRKTHRNPLRYTQMMYNTGESYLHDLIDPKQVMARAKKPSMSAEDLALAELGNYLSRNSRRITPAVEVPAYMPSGDITTQMGPVRSREDYAGYYTNDGEFKLDKIPSYPEYIRDVLGDALVDPSTLEGGVNLNEVRIKVPPKTEITSENTAPLPPATAKPRVTWDRDEMDAAEDYVKDNLDKPGAFRSNKRVNLFGGSSNTTEDVRQALGRGKKNQVLDDINKKE